jgi:hypothetical protein
MATTESAASARQKNASTLRRLNALPAQMGREITKTLRGWGAQQVADVRSSFRGRPGLISRSGHLRDSFTFKVDSPDSIEPGVRVYTTGTGIKTLTGQGYSTTQEGENGAPTIITPKRAGALTIPTELNVGSDGLPKYKSAAALRSPGRTKLIRLEDGRMFILVNEGGAWRAMWRLEAMVAIPPRLRFFSSFLRRDAERQAQIGRAVKVSIARN